MPIPKVYTTSSPQITTYTYTDLASGTGNVVYLGYNHDETTTSSYALTTNTIYSNSAVSSGAVTTTSFVKTLDLDFDILFNLPQRIRGKARAIFVLGNGTTGVDAQTQSYAVLRIRKWDGTNETEISLAQSESVSAAGSTEIEYNIVNFQVDINTIQSFKKGETLRCTVEVWSKKISTNAGKTYLLHDPKNRVDAASVAQTAGKTPITSIMEIHIPFVIPI